MKKLKAHLRRRFSPAVRRKRARDAAQNEAASSAPPRILFKANPEAAVERVLDYAINNTQIHVLKSRLEYYIALSHVYHVYAQWLSFDSSKKRDLISLIENSTPADKNTKTNRKNPIRIILRFMIRYPDTPLGSARKSISRDSQVIAYAEEKGVLAEEFVSKISEKGQGSSVWVKNHREQKRRSRANKLSNDLESPKSGHSEGKFKPSQGALSQDLNQTAKDEVVYYKFQDSSDFNLTRNGHYILIANFNSKTRILESVQTSFLSKDLPSKQKLEELISDLIRHSQ